MADAQTGAVDFGFTDKRRGRDQSSPALSEANNYGSVTTLKSRLTALNPTSYTAARLATMTVNDMVYALRLASADSAGI